jgi:hypothetical protein
VSRGRADAGLRFSGETEQDASRFEPQRLPSAGAGLSPDWSVVGVSRAEPTADPQLNEAAGHAGDTGAAESLRRRRIAPHHEDAVQRFFGGKP